MSLNNGEFHRGFVIGLTERGTDRVNIVRVVDPYFGEKQIFVDMGKYLTNVRRDRAMPLLPGFEKEFIKPVIADQEEEEDLAVEIKVDKTKRTKQRDFLDRVDGLRWHQKILRRLRGR
jgi:hypothetical protein